ncbi:hypothetical protein SELMODRAFT_409695 [Selaginella moellendorffii]|uniref:Uncharacterized protein n=1 Tax=Selaginella moellendorffii TaxID=88036 RepID=D8RC55_SELML|nr:hypothetical protein SELMODRAFT_409695 [Selaginella moellendorffii]
MWPVTAQELDCFFSTASDEQHSFIDYHQILADDGAVKKVSFDVALDTDDLCCDWGASSKKGAKDCGGGKQQEETVRKSHSIRSQRKISLCDCKSLLKKKLIDNRHTKWIQRQWEKHCGNPARIKDKLVAKNFLGRHHPSTCGRQHFPGGGGGGDNAVMASEGRKKLPLAYSFISFKAGISTVDFKTKLLPAECVQVWRRWKISKSLQLPFRRNIQISDHAAEIREQPVDQSSKFFQDHDVLTDCSCGLLMVAADHSSSDSKSQLQHDDFVFVSTGVDSKLQEDSTEFDNASASYVDVGVQGGSSTTDPVDLSKAPLVLEESACTSSSGSVVPETSTWSSQHNQDDPTNVSSSSTSDLAGTLPRRRRRTRSPSSDLTAEVTKYLLFRELLRRMSSLDQAACCSQSEYSASGDEQDSKEGEEPPPESSAEERAAASSIAETQKTIWEEVKHSAKSLSPYRALFEDRNKDLLQELLTSLSEEAQLIRQAWNCSLEETIACQEQAASTAIAPSKSEKEKERVSLFLSLKDGKIQLKDKHKDELQHDCLSNVVKQHGMTTGFYMKITQEELLKKLPSKTRTSARGRSVNARGRAITSQRTIHKNHINWEGTKAEPENETTETKENQRKKNHDESLDRKSKEVPAVDVREVHPVPRLARDPEDESRAPAGVGEEDALARAAAPVAPLRLQLLAKLRACATRHGAERQPARGGGPGHPTWGGVLGLEDGQGRLRKAKDDEQQRAGAVHQVHHVVPLVSEAGEDDVVVAEGIHGGGHVEADEPDAGAVAAGRAEEHVEVAFAHHRGAPALEIAVELDFEGAPLAGGGVVDVGHGPGVSGGGVGVGEAEPEKRQLESSSSSSTTLRAWRAGKKPGLLRAWLAWNNKMVAVAGEAKAKLVDDGVRESWRGGDDPDRARVEGVGHPDGGRGVAAGPGKELATTSTAAGGSRELEPAEVRVAARRRRAARDVQQREAPPQLEVPCHQLEAPPLVLLLVRLFRHHHHLVSIVLRLLLAMIFFLCINMLFVSSGSFLALGGLDRHQPLPRHGLLAVLLAVDPLERLRADDAVPAAAHRARARYVVAVQADEDALQGAAGDPHFRRHGATAAHLLLTCLVAAPAPAPAAAAAAELMLLAGFRP